MRFCKFFKIADKKARKAMDNVCMILNKIHLLLFMASLQHHSQHFKILASISYTHVHVDAEIMLLLSIFLNLWSQVSPKAVKVTGLHFCNSTIQLGRTNSALCTVSKNRFYHQKPPT